MSLIDEPRGLPRNGYAELAAEVRGLGLLGRRPGYYARATAVILLALGALVALMVVLRGSWWLMLPAVGLAGVSAQIGFLAHDAGHRQVARRVGRNRLLGYLFANLLTGLSYGWWVDKHNAHHAHPNDIDSDPDVRPGILVWDPENAATRQGAGAWLTRHQAWLFFPLLLLEAFNLHVSSVLAVLRPGLRNRAVEAVLLTLHFVGYAVLVLSTMTWLQAIGFVAIHQGLLGLYLGCAFAPNHKGMALPTAEEAADPLLRQVLTSRNVRGGPVVDYVLGGLNYQIEHHLFPSMPRPNLRLAQPVVRRYCESNGVVYTESTALASYGEALRHLNVVGAHSR
jgi:fatty acid desaturase